MVSKSPKSLLDYFKVNEKEVKNDTPAELNNARRPTRTSASRAREAWQSNSKNGPSLSSDSEDENEEIQGTRKRARVTRNKSQKNKNQLLLSKNGTLKTEKPSSKDQDRKKKPKLDPETEAFLRSGVPDVIEKEKSRAKRLEANKKDDDDDKIAAEKRIPLDAETIAFLHSGVPESVAKARQYVTEKLEQDEFILNQGFFPKVSHTFEEIKAVECNEFPYALPLPPFLNNFGDNLDLSFSNIELPFFKHVSNDNDSIVSMCCESNYGKINLKTSQNNIDKSDSSSRPLIDQLKVTKAKNLVVDKNALDLLTRWLKQWKSDIKDDGGTSRKQEKKKKCDDSDEFFTSDEEGLGLNKKSVLLSGPTGCGKTASVYTLANHFQFEVVEVNFSSRRSGKQVLQRVEEAVLSHRLKSSHNCLLLFKDIDLFHPDEDEGFFAAVSQLITTAVRPIVMTSCLPSYNLIDSKLDRKDPLRISFTLPKPTEIVSKILKPYLCDRESNKLSKLDTSNLEKWLDSIVRHNGCDIRRSINQLQLLMAHSDTEVKFSSDDIHTHNNPFQPHFVDLNFVRQSTDCQDNKSSTTHKTSIKLCVKQLEDLAEDLSIFTDLDIISRSSIAVSGKHMHMYDNLEDLWTTNTTAVRSAIIIRLQNSVALKHQSNLGLANLKMLTLESDTELSRWLEIEELNEEIGQYCDSESYVDWESRAVVRTIVKNNLLESSAGGSMQKRNGRVASYFNRLDRNLRDKISNTLGFKEVLND